MALCKFARRTIHSPTASVHHKLILKTRYNRRRRAGAIRDEGGMAHWYPCREAVTQPSQNGQGWPNGESRAPPPGLLGSGAWSRACRYPQLPSPGTVRGSGQGPGLDRVEFGLADGAIVEEL